MSYLRDGNLEVCSHFMKAWAKYLGTVSLKCDIGVLARSEPDRLCAQWTHNDSALPSGRFAASVSLVAAMV